MNYDFDPDGWIESMMTPEAAFKFCENAIFMALFDEIGRRDKEFWNICRDREKVRQWNEETADKILPVFNRMMQELVLLIPRDKR